MGPATNGATQNGAGHATAGASMDEETKDLRNRFEYSRYADAMKNELIEDILSRYECLVKTHDDYVQAHQHERDTAQDALMRVDGMQKSIDYLQRVLNRDPFILVLIDGNGMIFHHNFLKQGELGGKTAASIFNNAITDWASANVVEIPEETKLVVHVYANVKLVAEACAKAGIVESPGIVEEFIRGFTSADSLFNFTDVGTAKNVVEGKIVALLKLHLYNYYCRQVFLGCSHDDRYASILRDYTDDTQAKGRISLLEGVPFGQALATLPLTTLKIPGIFRDTKLFLPVPLGLYSDAHPRFGSNHSLNAASTAFTPRTNTPSLGSPFGSSASLDQHAMRDRSHSRVDSISSEANGGSPSWAIVTGKNAHRPIKNLMAPPALLQEPTIQRNKKGQRLDKFLDYNRDDVQRVKAMKSCNQHYIGVGCCHYNAGRADKCPHNHIYKLSQTDLKTLRVVARETPCKKGHGCDDLKCIYGHQCPFPYAAEGSLRGSGMCLNGESCRFPPSMHGMDLQPIRITKVVGI